jgi:phosphohistidine phosphatase
MRRLILMRHAKSSWANPSLRDRQRPLKKRGREDAARIGRHLRARGLLPGRMLLSPARRARETCDHLRRGMGPAASDVPAIIVEGLYEFDSPARLRRHIAAAAGDARCLLVIGHNEAIHELALELSGEGDPALLAMLGEKFPTAAVAVIDLPIDDWRRLAPPAKTRGRLVHHVRPRSLRPGG